MSSLASTGFLTQLQVLGSSSALLPPAKLSSVLLSKGSMKWKVVVESTGVPSASNTNPPVVEFSTQSPTPLVGMFDKRSPSMPNPPVGMLTGAVPLGGAGQS